MCSACCSALMRQQFWILNKCESQHQHCRPHKLVLLNNRSPAALLHRGIAINAIKLPMKQLWNGKSKSRQSCEKLKSTPTDFPMHLQQCNNVTLCLLMKQLIIQRNESCNCESIHRRSVTIKADQQMGLPNTILQCYWKNIWLPEHLINTDIRQWNMWF